MSRFESITADKNTDPEKWNEQWEAYLVTTFRPLPSYPDFAPFDDLTKDILTPEMLGELDRQTRQLCELQRDLAIHVSSQRDIDELDSEWLGLSPETRAKYILRGIVATSGHGALTEEERRWCPETVTSFLQRDGGKGFLDLLNIVLDTPKGERPSEELRTEPVFVSHPVVDAVWHLDEPARPGEDEGAREVMQKSMVLSRNHYLTLFVWNVLTIMYEEPPESEQRKQKLGSDSNKAGKKLTLKTANRLLRETKVASPPAEISCANCQKMEFELPRGQKFLRCSKCASVGRIVVYCNKDCQLKDWKSGKPPHKKICGSSSAEPTSKPTPTETSSKSSPTLDNVPPPIPGFVRSPELLHQLFLLQENPSVTYVLTQVNPEREHGVVLQHAMGKMMFDMMKGRAIRSGDPQAVATMCNMLEESASSVGMKKADLISQFSREYEIPESDLAELCKKAEKSGDMAEKTKEVDRLAAILDANLHLPS